MADIKYAAGTGGFVTAPYNLFTTELNTLASGNTAISSVGGTSGVFDQSNTGGYVWGVLSFVSGGTWTPAANGYIEGWWLGKDDATGYQKYLSNAAQARPADWVIGLLNTSHASGDVVGADGLVRLPAHAHKVLTRSVAGATMPSSGNKIMVGAVSLAI